MVYCCVGGNLERYHLAASRRVLTGLCHYVLLQWHSCHVQHGTLIIKFCLPPSVEGQPQQLHSIAVTGGRAALISHLARRASAVLTICRT
jgi:hypothetical protein